MNSFEAEDSIAPIRELSRGQRRVLGVLIEKGLTTPDGYPMTLKALTTGCNQKSNRDPVTNYSESQVEEYVEELRRLGLTSLLQTDGGRADRYRHLIRKRYEWSEPQVAIMAELWMRGAQTLGELRQRAGRMVSIDSIDDLRQELEGLIASGDLQSSGRLSRRGIQVDHKHYTGGEGPNWTSTSNDDDSQDDEEVAPASPATGSEAAMRSAGSPSTSPTHNLQLQQLEDRVQQLELALEQLRDTVSDLQTQLGV